MERNSQAVYLDYASMGVTSQSTLREINRVISGIAGETNSEGTVRTYSILEHYEKTRQLISEFLGVPSKNIAYINNTTHGLGLIAAGLELKPEDNVVISDQEFISSVLVWQRHHYNVGFSIRDAPSKNGCLTESELMDKVDDNTKAIVISAVQEVSGYRANLNAFSELSQNKNSFVIVDGIQESGVLTRSMKDSPVDAYIVGGHKWLGSPFGYGFMYLSDRLLESCYPQFDGYFNLIEPSGGWDIYLQDPNRNAFDKHRAASEARIFEPGGMPNFVGAYALGKSIEEIQQLGIKKIESHVLELNRYLRIQLQRLDLSQFILGSSHPDTFSGILTFGLPGGNIQEQNFIQYLSIQLIYVSLRSIAGAGGIRVSYYINTTKQDIDKFCNALEHFLENKQK